MKKAENTGTAVLLCLLLGKMANNSTKLKDRSPRVVCKGLEGMKQ